MKKWILKVLYKLTEEEFHAIDREVLRKWLFVSYKDHGWAHYYTMRKRTLLNKLGLGISDQQEYWETVGRLQELKGLSANINQEVQRRKKLQKKLARLDKKAKAKIKSKSSK